MTMSIPYAILCVLYILCCAALMAVILLQKKRTGGIGSVAGMGNAESYWDRNKSRSVEGTLEKWTKIGGAAFFVFSFVLCLL
jgi:preprotein translocase subunit SecG